MAQRARHYCLDCGPLAAGHYQKWIEDLIALLPHVRVRPPLFTKLVARLVDGFFVHTGILQELHAIDPMLLPARTRYFWLAASERGWELSALCRKGRPINQYFFRLKKHGRKHHFEGYPRAEHLLGRPAERIDDKYWVKGQLEQGGFPVAAGRAFWWWQAKRAGAYAHSLGYPVVVKPFFGSMSQHVYLDIKDEVELRSAIRGVTSYTPYFIIERYLPSRSVYRYNVINQADVFVAKRTPPYIVGDGQSTIEQLVESKNAESGRGEAGDQRYSRYRLLIDERTHDVLKSQGYTLESVPSRDEVVYVQDKVLLDLGAEIEEVTHVVHPDNLELARRIAQYFGVYVVGIDIIMQDAQRPWSEQETAILELNSLPYLDIHHRPEKGLSQDTAQALCDMVMQRYPE